MNTAIATPVSPAAIGAPCAGGILLGRFFLDDRPYALIGASKRDLPYREARWHENLESVSGALSVYDGLANTRAMAAAGSQLALEILALRIGGRDDWYLWSRGEALLGLAADFKGDEAFERDWYWTSSQFAGVPDIAWGQSFDNGFQYWVPKSDRGGVFAVRREPIR